MFYKQYLNFAVIMSKAFVINNTHTYGNIWSDIQYVCMALLCTDSIHKQNTV